MVQLTRSDLPSMASLRAIEALDRLKTASAVQRAVPNPKRGFTATSTAGTAIGAGHHHTAQ